MKDNRTIMENTHGNNLLIELRDIPAGTKAALFERVSNDKVLVTFSNGNDHDEIVAAKSILSAT